MLIRKASTVAPSEITSYEVYRQRRNFMTAAGGLLLGASLPRWGGGVALAAQRQADGSLPVPFEPNTAYVLMDKATEFRHATTYNNFYEFGTDKSDPARHAGRMQVRPWTVVVEGEVHHPRVFDIEDLLRLAPLEERVCRLRCVEGWSMVIPWIGYPLNALIRQVEPTGNARFVEFQSARQPEVMPGLRSRILDWPYVEGLRLDEASHPLALLAFGMYGQVLPNQNGAPVRVVVPWKYGFKSAKSIVRIRFTEKQPISSWMRMAPHEYGFYANVNPGVDHPRWSQATERRIGVDGFFQPKRATLMFNGYADQVAHLYQGMDLRVHY